MTRIYIYDREIGRDREYKITDFCEQCKRWEKAWDTIKMVICQDPDVIFDWGSHANAFDAYDPRKKEKG